MSGQMNIDDIMKRLPHRYPFLLVDRVLSFEVEKSITALKNVTYNEPQFMGHFPDHPVMPGVMMRNALEYFLLPGERTALAVCHAMSVDMTIVFPAPVASLRAMRNNSGLASELTPSRYLL